MKCLERECGMKRLVAYQNDLKATYPGIDIVDAKKF